MKYYEIIEIGNGKVITGVETGSKASLDSKPTLSLLSYPLPEKFGEQNISTLDRRGLAAEIFSSKSANINLATHLSAKLSS